MIYLLFIYFYMKIIQNKSGPIYSFIQIQNKNIQQYLKELQKLA